MTNRFVSILGVLLLHAHVRMSERRSLVDAVDSVESQNVQTFRCIYDTGGGASKILEDQKAWAGTGEIAGGVPPPVARVWSMHPGKN